MRGLRPVLAVIGFSGGIAICEQGENCWKVRFKTYISWKAAKATGSMRVLTERKNSFHHIAVLLHSAGLFPPWLMYVLEACSLPFASSRI